MWSRIVESSRDIRVDLVVGEPQPREARDVEDLVAVDHGPRL